jgi:hypothetical protein
MTTGNGNILLFPQNLVDSASLTASSAVGTLPVTNLADYRPSIVWRATGCAAEWVKADLGSTQSVQALVAWNHNWSNSGTIRVRVSDMADLSSPTYDSGTISAWPSIVGFGQGGFGGGGFGGVPVLSAFNNYRFYRVLILPAGVSGRYVRLDMADSTNSAGYVQIGRLFVGTYYQPTLNPLMGSNGLGIGWRDLGTAVRTDSGTVRFSRRGKFREMALAWDYLTEDEALTSIDDMGRIIGTSRDMFAVLYPDADLAKQYRTTLYAVPTVNGPANYSNFQSYAVTLTLQEIT